MNHALDRQSTQRVGKDRDVELRGRITIGRCVGLDEADLRPEVIGCRGDRLPHVGRARVLWRVRPSRRRRNTTSNAHPRNRSPAPPCRGIDERVDRSSIETFRIDREVCIPLLCARNAHPGLPSASKVSASLSFFNREIGESGLPRPSPERPAGCRTSSPRLRVKATSSPTRRHAWTLIARRWQTSDLLCHSCASVHYKTRPGERVRCRRRPGRPHRVPPATGRRGSVRARAHARGVGAEAPERRSRVGMAMGLPRDLATTPTG